MKLFSRRPEALVLVVSLVGSLAVLLAFAGGLLAGRQDALVRAEQRLQHVGTMLAEHTARSLDGVDILLRELARDLSQNKSDWRDWEDVRGWGYIAEQHSRSLPQLRSLSVFDQLGQQRFVSTIFPTPPVNVRDRTYFQALENGSESSSFGPYVGRNTGRYAFGLARRIGGKGNTFAGVAYATLELSYFQEFCWPLREHDDFDAVLVNTSSQIIASCRPVDLSAQSLVIGRKIEEVLLGGQFTELSLEPGQYQQQGALFSVVALPSHPELRVVSALPVHSALTAWQQRMSEFGMFAAMIVAILIAGGWMVRRQVIELATTSAELLASRRDLEIRVREATEELAQQMEEAERNSTAKSRFLAAASHDLRQPLHALSLFATDLQRQISSGYTRDIDQLATQINSSVVSLTEMLDTLLDISRLDMGGIQPDEQVFAVQTVFDRLHLSFRRAAVNKRLTLRLRPSQMHINSDIHLVERLLGNLISNAIRYTPDGGRVYMVARRRRERVVIEVRDSGLGIAPEHQQMIFKEFFQVGNSARDQKQGLGLGLAIVQRLTRALGAKLELKSRLGAGTLFSVSLPWSPPPVLEKSSAAALLFIGEDDGNMVKVAELAVGWGYACEFVEDVAEIKNQGISRPSIVLVPALLAAAIRAQLPREWPLVTIGTTAVGDGVFVIQAPIRPAKLRALLQQLQNTLSKLIL